MSKPTMPYQRLQRTGNILIAARGSSIDSFNLQDGSLLSTWTNAPSVAPPVNPEPSVSSPPAKRRKISTEEVEDEKEEPKGETSKPQNGSGPPPKQEKKKQNNRSDAVASGLESPAIICLAVTKDEKHVIAVTAEDKSVRVFENVVSDGGKQELVLLSLRQMPKRPCAIILTLDDQTIISADKFGDVYSLPLIPSPASSSPTPLPPSTPEPVSTPKLFTPAANELTIHSQRNRKALANQRRQKGNNPAPEKPSFAGTLLLGHVSMLTDLILGQHNGRSYILTADRDEHIRISRGIPQTHVIEGFCLGHEQFITRLCIPTSRETVLISGGGDDELYVWEWLSGNFISKVDLKNHVVAVVGGGEDTNITVSAIVHVQVPSQSVEDGMVDLILVTCEGIPALFTFHLTPLNQLAHHQTTPLLSNPLDLSIHTSLVISLDTIHEPGSTSSRRDPTSTSAIKPKPFQVFDWQKQNGLLVENDTFTFATDTIIDSGEESGEKGSLSNLLYSLENLRKREGEDKEE